jgi:hypothetical protein
MDGIFETMASHKTALYWVSGASVAMFVGSLLLAPLLIARAPEDFFVREEKAKRTAFSLVGAVLRNLLGGLLLIAGVLMLVLPGQGLLMLLLGLTLVDVPGKRTLVRRIVQKPPVWRALSYFRERAHKPPFTKP